MATTKYTLSSSWVQVATSTQDFIIDNASSWDVEITFQLSAPLEGAAYHTLQAGEGIVRMGLTGNVYARDSADGLGTAFIIVTV